MKSSWILAATSVALPLVACSSGGDDTQSTVQGLTAPTQVSIINADDSDINGSGAPGANPGAGIFPTDSAYVTDTAAVYVYDPAMEPLETINVILCTLGMSAYGDMVNQGNYRAQYQVDLCEKPNGDQGEGQSSGGVPAANIMTANSVRTDNTTPQDVTIWLPFPDSRIAVTLQLTEGVTEANPFGVWGMNYAMRDTFGTGGVMEEGGYLRTTEATAGKIGYQFVQFAGDVTQAPALNEDASEVRVAVEMSEDFTSGVASINSIHRENNGGVDSGAVTSRIKVVFDENHMKSQTGTDPVVVVSRTDFHNSVHRYNLYHNEGENMGDQVQLNSGFSFVTENGEFGWMGYHGVWLDSGSLSNGDTIYSQTDGGLLGDAYTVIQAPGKMVRNELNSMDLGDIGSTIFEWHEVSTLYRVDFDGTDFRRIASYDQNGETWNSLVSPSIIDVNANGGRLDMWSSSLGGSVTYLASAPSISYFKQSFVNGASEIFTTAVGGNIELHGLRNCLKSQMSASDVETGDIYLVDASSTSTPHKYRFNQSTLTLELDVNGDGTLYEAVGLAAGQVPTSGNNVWGMHSGPLVLDATGLSSVDDIWDVPVYYTYETGHNEWNKYTAVKDANDVQVEFDAPIQFLYTHSTAQDLNDDATYDGDSFLLEYGGPGNLHGFPYEEVDLNGDGNPDVYNPVINIESGTVMGPGGTEYIIRAIQVEQTLTLDPGMGASLDLTDADALTLPEVSDYSEPAIGDKPVVIAPPAVINGEVVTSDE